MGKGNIDVYVTNLRSYNEGNLIGEWVSLPVTSEEIKEVFKKIGVESDKDIFISDYDTKMDGLSGCLGMYENLEKLNYLAGVLENLSEDERKKYETISSSGINYYNNADELINLAFNLDRYDIDYSISDDEELGMYYFNKNDVNIGELVNYIDFESYGRDIRINEGSTITDKGYIRQNDRLTQYYDGSLEQIPAEYRLNDEEKTAEKPGRLSFNDFKNEISDNIREYLKHEEVERVEIYPVKKNNGVEKTALLIKEEGSSISPTIYLEPYYEDYCNGVSVEKICCQIASLHREALSEVKDQLTIHNIDKEYSSENFFIKVINYQKNKELLKDSVYERCNDLAAQVFYKVGENAAGISSARVTYDLLEHFGISRSEAMEYAKESTRTQMPIIIRTMSEALANLGAEVPEVPGLLVITNQRGIFGANAIIYNDILDEASKMLDSKQIYILPSSINEILALPAEGKAEYLLELVQSVNITELNEEEFLADSVYKYDSIEKKLSIAASTEKAMEKDNEQSYER